ncbi:MAG: 1-phosphofructokinase family hexose kinase [Candidatus Omnitrophica bacterium]|jgi:1-phosphofructokinase family hexose kinase|nr:1-phosphofructokinase family hexose kinase [Candidatus Omnitrophota bacterium]
MKPFILTVSLNPAVDKTVLVSNFQIGKDFREKSIFLSAGGKGVNVSRVLGRLGINNIACGLIGGSNGNYLKEQLTKEKIKHDFLTIKGNSRLSLTVIDPVTNVITRLLERGPEVSNYELNLFRKKFVSLLKNCRGVILSGRSIPGAPDSFYAELITIAKKKNIITVLDTSAKPYKLALLKRPFMIKPNLMEAEDLAAQKLNTLPKIKNFISSWHKKGIPVIALTLGSKGAIVSNQREMLLAQPPHVKRKNPVGCGDAFIAGFISAYLKNKNFSECVRLATSCGTANALSINPGFINLATLKKISAKVRLSNLIPKKQKQF